MAQGLRHLVLCFRNGPELEDSEDVARYSFSVEPAALLRPRPRADCFFCLARLLADIV